MKYYSLILFLALCICSCSKSINDNVEAVEKSFDDLPEKVQVAFLESFGEKKTYETKVCNLDSSSIKITHKRKKYGFISGDDTFNVGGKRIYLEYSRGYNPFIFHYGKFYCLKSPFLLEREELYNAVFLLYDISDMI